MKELTRGCRPTLTMIALACLLAILGPGLAAQSPAGFLGLRSFAEKRGIDIGAAIDFKLMSNPKYSGILASEFNTMTTENVMKMETMHPTADRYEWFFTDTLLDFTQQHNMKLRGHALIWHFQMPRWVSETIKTKEELLKMVHDNCFTIVNHYKGRIHKWDVVNEAVGDLSSVQPLVDGMRNSFYYSLAGTDFIDEAFKAAREGDPDCLLYYNDYSIEDINPKSDRLYALVKSMKDRGIPIDGIGFQAHFVLETLPDMASVRRNIERFVALGLRVDFTELDIRFTGAPTPERLKQQADAYKAVMNLILSCKGTSSMTVWGIDDGHSWVPKTFTSQGNALFIDSKYRPKPAYFALIDALNDK